MHRMSTPQSPKPQKPIRLTISVTPEVHAAFERLSSASGQSMSKCMGEWLSDTLDAVEYTANLVEKARAAPKMVMREVHAYALGLADETGQLLAKVTARGASKPAAETLSPRPVIRGGKSSGKAAGRGGKS